jgi:hypothetical protein
MIEQHMTLLVEELREAGLADPLAEIFTLAAVWDDLARLAGETPPPAVRHCFEDDGPTGNPAAWGPSLAPLPTAAITAPARD